MEWEDKVTMVKLGNSMNIDRETNPEKVKMFQEFVTSKLNDFDAQAMDMFFNIIELNPDEIRKDIKFYLPVYDKLQPMLKDKNINFGLRSSLRMEVFNMLIEETIIDK